MEGIFNAFILSTNSISTLWWSGVYKAIQPLYKYLCILLQWVSELRVRSELSLPAGLFSC